MSPSPPATSNPTAPKECGNVNSTCPTRQPDRKADDPPTNLLLCARCKTAAYCSKQCQAEAWPVHKLKCHPQNYILRFQLHPGKITNPPVIRTLSCPAQACFYDLHLALQTAFGWATTHSFDFAVLDPDYVPQEQSLLDLIEMTKRMSMPGADGRDPLAKREYLLRVVDSVPQSGFSGIDRMHEGQRRHPGTVEKNSVDYLLYKFFEDKKYQGKQMVYTYDFGDNWEHYITVVGREPATNRFICREATGHYVAEDVGSWRGWEDLKKAYQARSPTEEQRDRMAWFERMASNKDPLGLHGNRAEWVASLDEINSDLVDMYDRFQKMGDLADEQKRNFEKLMREAETAKR